MTSYEYAGRTITTDNAISEEEYLAKGIELFGEDRTKWVFVCPNCHNALSLEKAKVQFSELEGCGWRPDCECIGRYTNQAGCDWCAYGLFMGPILVLRTDNTIYPAFDFEGQPFTRRMRTR